jgi:hypothetical protein
MGSKLIGFRIADDLAQEVEAKAAERGLSTSEFLRELVDNCLYPDTGGSPGAKAGVATLDASVTKRLDKLEQEQAKLAKGLELAQVNQGLTQMVEGELKRIERTAKDRHNQLAATINNNTDQVKKIIPIVEGKLERVTSDLDLLYQAIDAHGHIWLENLKHVGLPVLYNPLLKSVNERVALAKKRRPISKID